MIEYLNGKELIHLLNNNKNRLIIDTRDNDYIGGHIKGSINIPSDEFQDDEDVDIIVQKYKNYDFIIFHCMMSQVRGPFCAKRFVSRLNILLQENDKIPKIYILKGGYKDFEMEFGHENDLFEDRLNYN